MDDHFAELNEPRRPWLDVEALKARFLALSGGLHPDRHHASGETERDLAGRRYAQLNTAYQTLKEPRSRLLHLIELETGARPRDIQRLPPGTMELFVEIGQGCRDADAFLTERRGVSSPMLKVRLFQRGLEWTTRLQELQTKVSAKGAAIDEALRALNPAWENAPAPGDPQRPPRLPLDQVEELYRALSYVARWTEQLQERLVQLASP